METKVDHYKVLGIPLSCEISEVKAAYRSLVLRKHPDKGGSREEFKSIQEAYETLADPLKRKVFDQQLLSRRDQWKDDEARSGSVGNEHASFLISVLKRSHEKIDPLKQLVVCCSICLRPSSFDCWICNSPLCLFCSRTPHSRNEHPMHWPLNNTPHMIDTLGMKEMEMKREHDAEAYLKEDPNYMPTSQKVEARKFTDACIESYLCEYGSLDFTSPLLKHHRGLEEFYAWTQTSDLVIVAAHNPFFLPSNPDSTPSVSCSLSSNKTSFCIADRTSRDLPPILHRVLSNSIDLSVPYEVITRGSFIGVLLLKGQQGKKWSKLFVGDRIAMRAFGCKGSLSCPGSYTLAHNQLDRNQVTMEIALPKWILSSDVRVDFKPDVVEVAVQGMPGMEAGERLIRTLSAGKKLRAAECHWALLPGHDGHQLLSIDLILEPAIQAQSMRAGRGSEGFVFVEDSDPYHLHTLLSELLIEATKTVSS